MSYNEQWQSEDDFGLFTKSFEETIQSFFSQSAQNGLKTYSANVLIGNISPLNLNEHIGDEFELCGFYVKKAKFTNGKIGKYVILFGYYDDKPVAYGSSSIKIYQAVMALSQIFGKPSEWRERIRIRIKQCSYGESGKTYSLEVLE